MGGADRGSAEQIPRRIVPDGGQSTEDGSEQSEPNKSRDVFENNPSGLNLPNDALDIRPEPPLVLGAELLARGADGLTWEASRDEIHNSAPRSAVEGCEIVPDRSSIQGRLFHPCHESGRCECFPLDVTDGAVVGEGDGEAKLEPTGPSA